MPNRIMRETITTSEVFAQLTAEEERMAHRLKVVADDFGRFDGRRAVIRARCFSLMLTQVSEEDVGRWIARLVAVGLLVAYRVGAADFVAFTEWDQEKRAKTSKYPAPPEHMRADASTCEQTRANVSETRDTRHENRDARETPRRARLPHDFTLTDRRRAFAVSKGLGPVEAEFEKFCDWHRAKGNTMLDWDAAWRTWVNNAVGRFAPRLAVAAKPTRIAEDWTNVRLEDE